MESQIVRLEEFVQIYLQLDLIIEQVKRMITNGRMYLEHLSSQLDMLSLGHVSPSIITPENLKKLLLEMQTKLPYHLTLPEDPTENLWKYYQSLSCTTILDEDKFLVIVSVPLLDRETTFEIYKVFNTPLPYYNQSIPTELQPDIVAQYRLETSALAINAEKTKYMLLNSDELNHCSTPLLSYCSVCSSVFPVNLSQRCIVSLFMNNVEIIETVCQKEVIPNSILPEADYLFDGIWIVASQKELKFSVVCSNYTKMVTANPPLDVITLGMACSGSNDYMTLTPYYHKESQHELSVTFQSLRYLKDNSHLKLWRPFTDKLPNFTRIEIPAKLRAVDKIPMDHLIEHLHGLRHLEKDKNVPFWIQSSIPVMSILLVILVVYFCVRYKPYQKFWLAKGRGKILQPTVLPAVPVETGDGSHIFRGHHSTQPEISAPMHVTTTSTTEATPLVYPVIELAAVLARDRAANTHE